MATKEIVTEVKTISTKLTKGEQIKLRLQLLWLWFLKNMKTFIVSFVLICIILTATGVITKDTFILGIIFGNLSEDIKNIISENGGKADIISALGSGASILVTSSLFAVKLKSLALSDIKSKKIKILLIRAGMYFDEEGKLTKKVEKLTNLDLDNDGKVNDTPVEEAVAKEENIVSGLKRAGSEFVTIIKADLSESETAETITTDIGLDDTANTVEEIKSELTGANTALFDEEKDENKKVGLFGKIKNILRNIKHNKKIIDTNVQKDKSKKVEEDAPLFEEVNVETKKAEEVITEVTNISEMKAEPVVQEAPKPVKETSNSTNDFLESLRRKLRN